MQQIREKKSCKQNFTLFQIIITTSNSNVLHRQDILKAFKINMQTNIWI